MLTDIKFHGLTCFAPGQHTLNDMKPVNLVFGPNGSGKTSITKAIGSGSCNLTWSQNVPLDIHIYNADYERSIINDSETLPGIFSLGVADTALLANIASKRTQIQSLEQKIGDWRGLVDPEYGKAPLMVRIEELEREFQEETWAVKKSLPKCLLPALKGHLASKRAFSQEVVRRSRRTASKTDQDVLELSSRADTVFSKQAALIPKPAVCETSILDGPLQSLLGRPILAAQDVLLSALLSKLNAHDWVLHGAKLVPDSDGQCPFCQQSLPHDFNGQLQRLFNQDYTDSIAALDRESASFDKGMTAIETALKQWEALPFQELAERALLLGTRYTSFATTVRASISRKKSQPSLVEAIQTPDQLLSQISELSTDIRRRVAEHNLLIQNAKTARDTLTTDVWNYLSKTILLEKIERYERRCSGAKDALRTKQEEIASLEGQLSEKRAELVQLERQSSTIAPTVHRINETLTSFGFENFRIAPHTDNISYVLIRGDGTTANHTLSEGEKTLIAFLYFASSVTAPGSDKAQTSGRIVVLDDPVSSLDTEVLYLVSTMVRQICEDIWKGRGPLQQLILLTHSIHFFKEVEFMSQSTKREGSHRRSRAYWLVRKMATGSLLERHTSNPVSTTYELLWSVIREESPDNISLQNAMRRILENYFKLLGGIDVHDLVQGFRGQERIAARALVSWVNEGSHSAWDEPAFPRSEATANMFRQVFRRIFEQQNQLAHYDMMIGHT